MVAKVPAVAYSINAYNTGSRGAVLLYTTFILFDGRQVGYNLNYRLAPDSYYTTCSIPSFLFSQ